MSGGVTFHDFSGDDLLALDLQPSQRMEAGLPAIATVEDARDREARGPAWTARDAAGRVICCAGFYTMACDKVTGEPRHAVAWAALSANIGLRAHLAITRFARARVERSALARIDAYMVADPSGRCAKWAYACGLFFQTTLANWGADGSLVLLFARVR